MKELQDFNLFLLRQGISSETAKHYVQSIGYLLSKIKPLTIEGIEAFLLSGIQSKRSPGGLNTFIIALRQYGRFAEKEEFGKIKFFPIKEIEKATMSDEEIEGFLTLPSPAKIPTAWTRGRYALMTLFFKVMAYTGMRPGEVAGLTVGSVDFGRNVFILGKTKTTPRLVPISPALVSDLTEHIKKLDGDYLFYGRNTSEPITKSGWNIAFSERMSRLGIKRNNLSTYSLRHSFITRWAGQDINIFKIQRMVGHKRISTTAQYMHLVTKDLVSATKKDPLIKNALSKKERIQQIKEMLEIEGFSVIECRELKSGNYRLEIT